MSTRDKQRARAPSGRAARRLVRTIQLLLLLVVAIAGPTVAGAQNQFHTFETDGPNERAVTAPDLVITPPRNPPGFHVAGTLTVLLADRLRVSSGISVAAHPDVASYFHGKISIDRFSVRMKRHHLRHYWNGFAIASFSIWDPRRETIVFNKQVVIKVSRRRRHSDRAEIINVLLNRAVEEWDLAFLSLPSSLLQTRRK